MTTVRGITTFRFLIYFIVWWPLTQYLQPLYLEGCHAGQCPELFKWVPEPIANLIIALGIFLGLDWFIPYVFKPLVPELEALYAVSLTVWVNGELHKILTRINGQLTHSPNSLTPLTPTNQFTNMAKGGGGGEAGAQTGATASVSRIVIYVILIFIFFLFATSGLISNSQTQTQLKNAGYFLGLFGTLFAILIALELIKIRGK